MWLPGFGAFLAVPYARAGRREEAEKLAADRSLSPFNQARTFACLGDKDRTFEALRFQGYSQLRGDPRMKALRKRVGLPE
jgi:hypothetical protein